MRLLVQLMLFLRIGIWMNQFFSSMMVTIWILIRYRLRLLLPLVLNRRNCLLISLPRYGVSRMKRLRKFWSRQPYCCGRELLMISLADIPPMTELYDTSVFVVSFILIPSLLPSPASPNGVIPVLRCLLVTKGLL